MIPKTTLFRHQKRNLAAKWLQFSITRQAPAPFPMTNMASIVFFREVGMRVQLVFFVLTVAAQLTNQKIKNLFNMHKRHCLAKNRNITNG